MVPKTFLITPYHSLSVYLSWYGSYTMHDTAHLSHNIHHAFYMHASKHPSSLSRESLAHIPRFSLSVAVLQVKYIPHTQVLLQSFPHTQFPPFHSCSWASPFTAKSIFQNTLYGWQLSSTINKCMDRDNFVGTHRHTYILQSLSQWGILVYANRKTIARASPGNSRLWQWCHNAPTRW
jgi:hypothetical protein